MSDRYLITQSLLSSYAYQFDCREECAEEARESFLATLRREPKETTEAMQNGIDFENLVYSIAHGNFRPIWHPSTEVNSVSGEVFERYEYPKWYTGAKKVAERISGAHIQVKLKREIEVDGMNFLVYGILDGLKAGVIYDVKFKNKSFGSVDVYGDYVDSPQHPAYFYLCPEAYEFNYLVSDGEDLYIETYRPEETKHIGTLIHDFLQGIKSGGDLETYKEHWLAL